MPSVSEVAQSGPQLIPALPGIALLQPITGGRLSNNPYNHVAVTIKVMYLV